MSLVRCYPQLLTIVIMPSPIGMFPPIPNIANMLGLGRLRRFLQRNLGRITLGAICVPIFIRLTRMAARRYITYQTMKTHDLLLRYKKQRMFELMEENFESSFKKWHELMMSTIKTTLNAEKHMDLLRSGDGTRKLENWMEMKIIAFANIWAIIYGTSMLSILLRIQLNVISGLLFKQMELVPPGLEETENIDIGGAGDASSHPNHFVTEELQQEYMMLTRYLCTDGIRALCELLRTKCRYIIANLSLKQKLTIADIEQLLVQVRNKELKYTPINLESDDDSSEEVPNDWDPISEAWYFMLSKRLTKRYLYPPKGQWKSDSSRDLLFKTLIGEAFDLVKSDDTKNLLKFLETQGLNHYMDRLSDFLSAMPPDASTSSAGGTGTEQSSASSGEGLLSEDSELSFFNDPAAPVAKLIPVMNSFVNLPFNQDPWAVLLLNQESLKSYSANIYESYSSKEFDF